MAINNKPGTQKVMTCAASRPGGESVLLPSGNTMSTVPASTRRIAAAAAQREGRLGCAVAGKLMEEFYRVVRKLLTLGRDRNRVRDVPSRGLMHSLRSAKLKISTADNLKAGSAGGDTRCAADAELMIGSDANQPCFAQQDIEWEFLPWALACVRALFC